MKFATASLFALLAFAFLLTLTSAQSAVPGLPGTTCSPTQRCGPGLECVSGKCEGDTCRACETNNDCAPSWRCDLRLKRCMVLVGLSRTCGPTTLCLKCRSGLVCNDGKCIAKGPVLGGSEEQGQATEDVMLPDAPGKKMCSSIPGKRCGSGLECMNGVCEDMACKACEGNGDCADRMRCDPRLKKCVVLINKGALCGPTELCLKCRAGLLCRDNRCVDEFPSPSPLVEEPTPIIKPDPTPLLDGSPAVITEATPIVVVPVQSAEPTPLFEIPDIDAIGPVPVDDRITATEDPSDTALPSLSATEEPLATTEEPAITFAAGPFVEISVEPRAIFESPEPSVTDEPEGSETPEPSSTDEAADPTVEASESAEPSTSDEADGSESPDVSFTPDI